MGCGRERKKIVRVCEVIEFYIGRAEYGKKLNKKLLIYNIVLNKYILNIYNLKFKYIGRSGWVRRVVIVMTQTPTQPAIKKNFITQPNPSTPKNRPNSAGWVEFGSVLTNW